MYDDYETDEERALADENDQADCIAAGYEWICPHCESNNTMIETQEYDRCSECQKVSRIAPPEHAIGGYFK